MNSARAKWVPTYKYRKLIDNRDHESSWSPLFGTSTSISFADFKANLHVLKSKIVMGPSISVSLDEPISDTAVDLLWRKLTTNDSLTADDVR